jgi:hypothetical protein
MNYDLLYDGTPPKKSETDETNRDDVSKVEVQKCRATAAGRSNSEKILANYAANPKIMSCTTMQRMDCSD